MKYLEDPGSVTSPLKVALSCFSLVTRSSIRFCLLSVSDCILKDFCQGYSTKNKLLLTLTFFSLVSSQKKTAFMKKHKTFLSTQQNNFQALSCHLLVNNWYCRQNLNQVCVHFLKGPEPAVFRNQWDHEAFTRVVLYVL